MKHGWTLAYSNEHTHTHTQGVGVPGVHADLFTQQQCCMCYKTVVPHLLRQVDVDFLDVLLFCFYNITGV